MGEVFLRRLSRWQADASREALADLFVTTYTEPPGEEFHNRERFVERLAEDVQRPGFDLVLAEDSALVGCAYGFPVHRDGSWWRGFIGTLPEDIEELTASGKVFAVAELMVRPRYQRSGIADRMLTRLLATRPAVVATALVEAGSVEGVAAFRAWGWKVAGQLKADPHQAARTVFVQPLQAQWQAR
jgi:GNAT superfamily N-acetyltransferase